MAATPTSSNHYDTRRIGSGWLEAAAIAVALAGAAWLARPQTSDAADHEAAADLRDDLQFLRTQIMVYRAQHAGRNPGYPGGDETRLPDVQTFIAQMSHYSDAEGNTSATPTRRHGHGPYLHEMPANAFNGHSEIVLVLEPDFPAEPVAGAGWLYQPSTGRVIANLSGGDGQGKAYRDY